MANTNTGGGPTLSTAAERVLTRLSTLHGSNTLADIEIISRDRSWKAHSFVFALHSEVLLRKCETQDKIRVRRLDLSDWPPALIDRFLCLLYTMDYPTDVPGTPCGSLVQDINMHSLAHLYDIPPLKTLAVKKFKHCTSRWASAFVSTNIGAVGDLCEMVHMSPPLNSGFLDLLIDKVVASGIASESDATARKLFDIMSRIPDVGVKILQRSAARGEGTGPVQEDQTLQRYKCPNPECEKEFADNEWHLIHHCPGCDELRTPREWSECKI